MVDTLKALSADAVEKAGHGHPGTAISLAPVAWQLYQNVMHLDPTDDRWEGRDRFILSAGHASLIQYLQLFAAGAGLEIEDIQGLRTEGIQDPGPPGVRPHPRRRGDHGSAGPGPGDGRRLRVRAAPRARADGPRRRPGTSPFDHHVFVLASDGDIQEGVAAEASSLAGHQELGNLVVVYDANRISIEDDTDIAFTEDVVRRYEAYGWHVQEVDWTNGAQGHAVTEYTEDVEALYDALVAAKAETGRPSLIKLRTVIGWPSPRSRTPAASTAPSSARTRSPASRRASGWTRPRPSTSTPSSWPAPGPSPSARQSTAAAGRWRSRPGARRTRRTRGCTTDWPDESCPLASRTRSRPGTRTRRAWPRARPPERCSRLSRRSCPSSGAARPTSPGRTTPP